MADGPDLRFDPVEPRHYGLLRGWLAQPHWREWWGDPEIEFGFIRDMVEGRDPASRPFIFLSGGQPVGYIQYWHLGPYQTEEWARDNPWLMAFPADAIGVDLSIGEEASLSRGLGRLALRCFVERLRALGHKTIIIDPDPRNLRAVRAYEKAGFVAVPHLKGRFDGVLIMQHGLDSKESIP